MRSPRNQCGLMYPPILSSGSFHRRWLSVSPCALNKKPQTAPPLMALPQEQTVLKIRHPDKARPSELVRPLVATPEHLIYNRWCPVLLRQDYKSCKKATPSLLSLRKAQRPDQLPRSHY